MSLGTRRYREAEHRAALLDLAFSDVWGRVLSEEKKGAGLGPILRAYLREVLERDMAAEPPDASHPLPMWPLGMLEATLEDARGALADRDPRNCAQTVEALMQRHGLPEHVRHRLGIGVLEAEVRRLEEAIRRAKGEVSLVLPSDVLEPAEPTSAPPASVPSSPVPSPTPLASALVELFFDRREKLGGATHQVMGQERGTLRRFLEVCGDRPVDAYNRGDISRFLDTLRRLPSTYGKSPKDKVRSLADIITEADTKYAERLTDKTVKRHLSALSQFFRIAMDLGHLTVTARRELVDDHQFRDDRAARDQRDAWTPEELTKLFASPVWMGCLSPDRRSQAGPEIIRDAKFWLPILALYHGARLEEFADLYRRDIERDAGIWCVSITEAGDRRLKNENAKRVVALHPEVIRLGFLEYVASVAPQPDDPLFPDLEPQGKDRKRGPRFTRFFVNYRKQIDLYREGVGMHAFRHTANTRLRDAITDWQQERHVAYLLGHSQGGGEGRERYDKGPGLKAAAQTLALLRYPEIDLSRHYVREPGDFRAPGEEVGRQAA